MVFDALADGTRRRIFEQLRHGPRGVSDIAASMPVSRPAVSQHLRVLEHAALVSVRPVGRRRIYAINRRGLDALRSYVDTYWDDVLAAYAEAASEQANNQEEP
jgi:DNA-binding transcriptional ArsR family regulator